METNLKISASTIAGSLEQKAAILAMHKLNSSPY